VSTSSSTTWAARSVAVLDDDAAVHGRGLPLQRRDGARLEPGGGAIMLERAAFHRQYSSVMGASPVAATPPTAREGRMAHYTRLSSKDSAQDPGERHRRRLDCTSALEIVMTTPELKQMMEEMTLLVASVTSRDRRGVVFLASRPVPTSPARSWRSTGASTSQSGLPTAGSVVLRRYSTVSASATMSRGPDGQSKYRRSN